MLIGPEMEMYALSLYQNLEIPSGVKEKDTSCLRLTFDYGALGEYSFVGGKNTCSVANIMRRRI